MLFSIVHKKIADALQDSHHFLKQFPCYLKDRYDVCFIVYYKIFSNKILKPSIYFSQNLYFLNLIFRVVYNVFSSFLDVVSWEIF
jgi:hypothetical protein